MKGFVEDIGRLTEGNADFRRVLYTGQHLQLVLMTLGPVRRSARRCTRIVTSSPRRGLVTAKITIDGKTIA